MEKENNSSSADNEFLKKNAEILEYGSENPSAETVSSNAAEYLSAEADESKRSCCGNSSAEPVSSNAAKYLSAEGNESKRDFNAKADFVYETSGKNNKKSQERIENQASATKNREGIDEKKEKISAEKERKGSSGEKAAKSQSSESTKRRECFIIPELEELEAYCRARNSKVKAEIFYDFYQSKGWCIGKTRMRDWKAAVRSWEHIINRNLNTYGNANNTRDFSKYIDNQADYGESDI
ncbi:MAG: hypothetical protein IJ748_05505 [Bacteroidales bacterium]|nr:hypothetical protein [Bacteroidales bacterium]